MMTLFDHPARRGDGSYILTALAGGIEPERRFHAPDRVRSEEHMLDAHDAGLASSAHKDGVTGERTSQSFWRVKALQ